MLTFTTLGVAPVLLFASNYQRRSVVGKSTVIHHQPA